MSDQNIFNYQAKIIKDLAEKGPCIIIGRCADFILKDMENVLHRSHDVVTVLQVGPDIHVTAERQ
ncbi:cytidylate kinase family protein, partial [Acinetobacter baumannii]|uniref:cytidylate kinase family protein n=1 Tax=Acinetobacter baumannii TaxID=470 RepID=UPI0031F3BA5F